MNAAPTPFEALQLAVEKAGSQAKLAAICEVSQTAVWKWLQSSKRLPAEHILSVEAATGVSRYWLRPDIHHPVHANRFIGVDHHATRVPFNNGDEMQRGGA